MKKTLVLGASPNPARYSYQAVLSLKKNNHEVVALGVSEGHIGDSIIYTEAKEFENIDTVTMYLSKPNQAQYYDYILNMIKPKRIIFNPGAENQELAILAKSENIITMNACTLVLLSNGSY